MASKKEFIEDNFSDHSIDDDTMPDEEFNLFKIYRDKLPSYPDIKKKGPNINLKIQHKRYNTQKEKEFFLAKIQKKKKTELCKTYEIYHDCYYKDDCCFAHGMEELRENSSFSSYKIKMCQSFQKNSVCNFGIRCSYKHCIK